MERQPPLVILLDLDGTVLGDITPQVIVYEMLEECKKVHGCKVGGKLPSHDLSTKLTSGVVRPNFDRFFNDITRKGMEVFVYTASEKKWAEHIVKQIEKTYDLKFNRPIFTRNHCMFIDKDYKKSIRTVRTSIVRTLNKKYHAHWTEDSLRDHVLIIDNRPVYSTTDLKYMVQCPTYTYAIPENIPSIITPKVYDQFSKQVHGVLQKYYGSVMKPVDSYLEFEKQYYLMYIPQLQSSLRQNASLQDKFFRRMRKLFVKRSFTLFDDKTIQYIQRKVIPPSTQDVLEKQ